MLFPAPEGPTIAIISPRSIGKSMPSSGAISCVPASKDFAKAFGAQNLAWLGDALEASARPIAATPELACLCIICILLLTR